MHVTPASWLCWQFWGRVVPGQLMMLLSLPVHWTWLSCIGPVPCPYVAFRCPVAPECCKCYEANKLYTLVSKPYLHCYSQVESKQHWHPDCSRCHHRQYSTDCCCRPPPVLELMIYQIQQVLWLHLYSLTNQVNHEISSSHINHTLTWSWLYTSDTHIIRVTDAVVGQFSVAVAILKLVLCTTTHNVA